VENVQDKKCPILRAKYVYILRQMNYAFSFVFKNKQNNVTRKDSGGRQAL